MFREFMHPMNWSDCLCERFNFPVKCKGGCCAQGIGAKVRDDENCEYQMEHLLWFEITLALTDVSGRLIMMMMMMMMTKSIKIRLSE